MENKTIVYFADNKSYPLWAVERYNFNLLISYAYKEACKYWFGVNRQVMLDSGAFTLSTKGIAIDIDRYIGFYFHHSTNIHTVVSLDVIPKEFTPQALELSAEQGWQNYLYIRSKNVPAIHVYHQGESKQWLTKICDKCEYFGVSPNDRFSTKEKFTWLTEVFSYLCNSKGIPARKTHGFGVAGKSFINFPFYSVDSSKPIQMGARKRLLIELNNQIFEAFDLGKKDSYIPENKKEQIESYLNRYSMTLEQVARDISLLRVINAISLRNMYSNDKQFEKQEFLF